MQTYADPRNVDDPLKIAADLASRQVPDAVDVLNALPIETTAGVVGLLPRRWRSRYSTPLISERLPGS